MLKRVRICAVVLALTITSMTGVGNALAAEPENLALGKQAVASSEVIGPYTEPNAIDGDPETGWQTDKNPAMPVWFMLDLNRAATFNQIVLSVKNNVVTSYQIQVSQDGKAWTDVFTGGALPRTKTINFETQTARYVRFYAAQKGPELEVGIQEFELYYDTSPEFQLTPNEKPGIYETPQTAAEFQEQARELMSGNLVMRCGEPNLVHHGEWEKLDGSNPEIVPIRQEKEAAVPLRAIAERLGGEAVYQEADDSILVRYAGKRFVLREGDSQIQAGEQTIALADPVTSKDCRTLAPLSAIRAMFGKHCFQGQDGLIVLSDLDLGLDQDTPENTQLLTYLAQEFSAGLYQVLDISFTQEQISQTAGEPAVIADGAELPGLKLSSAYSGRVKGRLYGPDGTGLADFPEQAIQAGAPISLECHAQGTQTGTYRYEVSFSSGFKDYHFCRYVTVTGEIPAGSSPLAYLNQAGKLAYTPDYLGNRIMDYSTAGYGGGGVPLPEAPVKETVPPAEGDSSGAIQAAIDRVSALPPDENGIRGAVELQPGVFRCEQAVKLTQSGVVLRGSGSGKGETVIELMAPANVSVSGTGNYTVSGRTRITDRYVPSGTGYVHVENPELFRVGDQVQVTRQATGQWLRQVGMDQLYRDGSHQTWLAEGTTLSADRTVTKIQGNTLFFDAALPDRIDADYDGASPVVEKYTYPGRITNAGVENLRIIVVDKPSQPALDMSAAMDAWMKDIVIEDGTNSLNVRQNCRRVTCENIEILHSEKSLERAAPSDFTVTGTQTLLYHCRSSIGAGMWSFTTGSRGAGPIAIVNSFGGLSPHQRWTTGMLLDNSVYPDPRENTQGVSFRNRNTMGSGHGWTTGWSVAWNVETPYFLVSAAPGTMNWSVGGIGEKTSVEGDPDGIYSAHGAKVQPESLYQKQLEDRMGESHK